jgi:hypothetical protein
VAPAAELPRRRGEEVPGVSGLARDRVR